MAESCIVCLGDLRGQNDPPSLPQSSAHPAGDTVSEPRKNISPRLLEDPETIAYLLPCQHNLHHECLKPWVERANSCPICRSSFNQVELKAFLDGPTLDSYAVQERVQRADIDPSMVVEHDLYYDEPGTDGCLICEGTGDDDVLLLCDGCNASCHTYCVGLNSVPAGAWFCQFCHEDGTAREITGATNARPRTRRQQRRNRSDRGASAPSEWTRVWQSVWNRLNFDLDFPFDEEAETEHNEAHRREFEEWQRRFRVAERQGGAARFRDTAATLLDMRNGHAQQATADVESQEEIRAWNAFDKAQELESLEESGTDRRPRASSRNKRKSVTPAPQGEPTETAQPERKLKRPRTRRIQGNVGPSGDGVASSSSRPTPTFSAAVNNQSGQSTPRARDPASPTGHSFLQSLLQEVEGSSDSDRGRTRLPIHSARNGHTSPPRSLSPLSSPGSSAPSSPRIQSASPRPQSPTPLTSRIEPIFSEHPPPAFSPASPSVRKNSVDRNADAEPPSLPKANQPANVEPDADAKRGVSYATKTEIQALVAAALKPAYRKKSISAEQYTDVNREVSRRLYESLPGSPTVEVGDQSQRHDWAAAAQKEVDLELRKLDVDLSV